jgi:tyrosyl-tRNA synthetase
MVRFPPVAEQLALLSRGVVDLHVRAELEERLTKSLETGVPLRVKAGFDPTRPDLHIGHAVLMQKMRQFQVLGHQVIFLVGGFTAMIGDPTGQNEARPRLTREEVDAAAQTYLDQAFLILDKSVTEVVNNHDWLGALTPSQFVELMAKVTVSRMLERNDFAERFAAHRPIYQHEFLYPLAQAYDSVAIKADIELGGTDQLFNLLMGRDLMEKYGMRGQMVMTTPLLEGIDAKIVERDGKRVVVGKKMSKSADNYVGIREKPIDQYRKIMQVDDEVIWRYFELLSAKSNEEIAELRKKYVGGDPREAKGIFAKEIITRFHDAAAAEHAEAEFRKAYTADAIPDDVPTIAVPTDQATIPIYVALKIANLVTSSSDGMRLVEQGGVELDRARVSDPKTKLERGKKYLVRVGSKNRKFAYLVVGS